MPYAPKPRPRVRPPRYQYGHAWTVAAKRWLTDNPLCANCARQGITQAGECVDHVIPHRKNRALFWDHGNWQTLCVKCHHAKTMRGE